MDLIHPSFMGGEYLPDYGRDEVEIARIELDSTTSDVINVRAQPRGKRIRYSVCDEYGWSIAFRRKLRAKPSHCENLFGFWTRLNIHRLSLSGSALDLFSHLTKPIFAAVLILKRLKISRGSAQSFIRN